MTFHWPYYTLRNGRLIDDSGDELTNFMNYDRGRWQRIPDFADGAQAEQWLADHDMRGNVR